MYEDVHNLKNMAKKQSNKTQSKELKPDIQDKKEITKSIPTTDTFRILLFKTNQEYVVTKEIGEIIIKNNRGKLV